MDGALGGAGSPNPYLVSKRVFWKSVKFIIISYSLIKNKFTMKFCIQILTYKNWQTVSLSMNISVIGYIGLHNSSTVTPKMPPGFSFNTDLTSSVNAPKIELAITTWEHNTLQALSTYKSLQFMNNMPVNWWRLKVERLDSQGNKTIYHWLSPYVGHYFGNALVLGHYYTQKWDVCSD